MNIFLQYLSFAFIFTFFLLYLFSPYYHWILPLLSLSRVTLPLPFLFLFFFFSLIHLLPLRILSLSLFYDLPSTLSINPTSPNVTFAIYSILTLSFLYSLNQDLLFNYPPHLLISPLLLPIFFSPSHPFCLPFSVTPFLFYDLSTSRSPFFFFHFLHHYSFLSCISLCSDSSIFLSSNLHFT